MLSLDPATVILTIEGTLYALMATIAFRKRRLQEDAAAGWLVAYAAVSCLWTLGQVWWETGWPARATDRVLAPDPSYGLLILGWLFLPLTRAFLRLGRTTWGWWALGGVWIATLALVSRLISAGATGGTLNGRGISRLALVPGVLLLGWACFVGGAALLIARAQRQTQQPLHRNRITYWSLALGLTAIGDVLFFAGYRLPGGLVRAAATLLAAYAIVTHQLPDIRRTVRRGASYLIITLLIMTLYTAGFMAMHYVFQAAPGYSPLVAGAVMALVLAILFQPLLAMVQRTMNRLIARHGYDPNHILHEYSTCISNILDLELLATVMLNLISETMRIRHGHLFLVDGRGRENGEGNFQLRAVGSVTQTGSSPIALAPNSPIAGYLRQQKHNLTQYDIDLLARFQAISAEERAWVTNLNADVYVPIHAKGEWIGLLALGPKMTGERYFDEDLALLRTLADQTAVALENARLMEDLIRAHDDLGQTYAALADANRQLQELDDLKSDFIGVITHELRTPFANICFSLELLERHGQKHLPPELQDQLEQMADGVHRARRMVDNLVTFATFLSKQGKLHPTRLDLCRIVQDCLVPLEPLAESKGITLHTQAPEELPQLAGDRDRLGDAVYHLIHNAIKFTEPGGKVWVTCLATDRAVRFEVQDTGVGVPADKLPALWDGFAQMANPLCRGEEGLGLGLTLVKYVVNAHGGEVFAHSKEGVGSTFGFEIPLQ